jgi:hypothetical protein
MSDSKPTLNTDTIDMGCVFSVVAAAQKALFKAKKSQEATKLLKEVLDCKNGININSIVEKYVRFDYPDNPELYFGDPDNPLNRGFNLDIWNDNDDDDSDGDIPKK